MNFPIPSTTAGLSPMAGLRTHPIWEKSTPPRSTPMGGMMTSPTSDDTILPNAAPITPDREVEDVAAHHESLNSLPMLIGHPRIGVDGRDAQTSLPGIMHGARGGGKGARPDTASAGRARLAQSAARAFGRGCGDYDKELSVTETRIREASGRASSSARCGTISTAAGTSWPAVRRRPDDPRREPARRHTGHRGSLHDDPERAGLKVERFESRPTNVSLSPPCRGARRALGSSSTDISTTFRPTTFPSGRSAVWGPRPRRSGPRPRGVRHARGPDGVLFSLLLILEHRVPLRGPLTIMMVADEEAGGAWGTGWILEHRPELAGGRVHDRRAGIAEGAPGR
jgi:hypothetical protein